MDEIEFHESIANLLDTPEKKKILNECDKEKKKIRSAIKREYKEKRSLKEEELREPIDSDKTHREIINSCITPFEGDQLGAKAGYVFVRASPLEELEVPNFDFLIFNEKNGVIILGEATSINSAKNQSRKVKQLKERMKVVYSKKEYIAREYLKYRGEVDRLKIEFVIALPSLQAADFFKKLRKQKVPIIVWQVGLPEKILSLFNPLGTGDSDKKLYLHSHKELNRILHNLKTDNKSHNLFPQSHPCAQLQILILIAFSQFLENDREIKIELLESIIKDDMFYLKEEERTKIIENVLDLGKKIGIVLEENNRYILKTRAKTPRRIEVEIRERWIKWSLKNKMDREIHTAISEINESCYGKLKNMPRQAKLPIEG